MGFAATAGSFAGSKRRRRNFGGVKKLNPEVDAVTKINGHKRGRATARAIALKTNMCQWSPRMGTEGTFHGYAGGDLRQGLDRRQRARSGEPASAAPPVVRGYGLPCRQRIRRAREWWQRHRIPKAARSNVYRRCATRVRPVARLVARPFQPPRYGGDSRLS